MYAIVSIAVIAAAATLGDFIWYTVGVRHSMAAGLVHGALLLTTVGAALRYFLLILVMDSRTYGTAIPGAWVIMWLLLAALDGR